MSLTLSEILDNVQPGDEIFMALHGAGYVTTDRDPVRIEHVDRQKGFLWFEGADEDYTSRSVYAINLKTGKGNSNFGFYRQVITPVQHAEILVSQGEDEDEEV